MKGFTDIGRGTLDGDSGAGKDAKPLDSKLLTGSGENAVWVAGAGKVDDGGNTEVGEETNALASPPEV